MIRKPGIQEKSKIKLEHEELTENIALEVKRLISWFLGFLIKRKVKIRINVIVFMK